MERKNAETKGVNVWSRRETQLHVTAKSEVAQPKVRTTTAWDFLGTNYLIGPDLSAQVWMAPTIWVVN
jgi:hypothetical protein